MRRESHNGLLELAMKTCTGARRYGIAWVAGLLTLACAASVFGDLRTAPAWYDQNAIGTVPDWHYRVPVTIPPGTPVNSTIRVDVDFNALLAQLGVSGTFDVNSPRVVRSTGALATNQEFTDAVYAGATDGLNNGRGEVRFILQDAGPVTYQLYFDITQNAAKPANPQTPINGGFEFGGAGTEDPPGWGGATKAHANFDAQIRPGESPTITTNAAGGAGSVALPSATRVTDGTPFVGNFSYMLGARTNNEPSNSNPSVTLNRTIVVPASCASGFRLRYRVEGWDSSANGAGVTTFDFLRIRLIGGATTELVGPPAGTYTSLPFSPNIGLQAATNALSGYRQYNGWDTSTNGVHRSGMTTAPLSQPWWLVTNSLASYLGQTITLRITSSNQTLYKSWFHIDDVEWCVVAAALGTPVAFGANITAPLTGASFTAGQTLAVTAQVDAIATGAGNPVVAYLYNPSGTLVAGPVNLAAAGGGVYTNAAVYTFAGGDAGGIWTVRVYARDASTSTVGATNGLVRIAGQPATPESQANFHNVDEVTIAFSPPPSNPGGFNAYDTTTAPGAITGFIRTKVAGAAFNLDVIALDPPKTGILGTFTGSVRVELVDASSGGAPDANGCVPGWPVVYTVLPNPGFGAGDAGRRSVSFTVPDSYRNLRVRVVYPSGDTYAAATAKGCSNDNFAIRPAGFGVTVTDSDWATAGAGRTLDNAAATGGVVHKAGHPFTITVTPSPGSATSYDGSPAVGTLSCTLPGGCVNGTLVTGAYTGAGARVASGATYSEAGAFNLTLVDQDYAAVDAGDGTPADCSANGRYVCQSPAPLAVGRFVPDRFEFAGPSAPVLRTFNTTACAPRSFTYIGQPFWYGTLPSATLSAVNVAGTITQNYPVSSSRPAITEGYADATAPATAPLNSSAIGTALLTAGAGTGTYSASLAAGAQLSYDRHPVTPVAPFTAAISLTVSATDGTESAVPGNGTITSAAPLVFNGGGAGIAFDSGAQLRYGRLQAGSARGSPLAPLTLPFETQYWDGTAFATNAADYCTALATANIGLGNFAGNLNAGETTPAFSGSFSAGRAALTLSAPGAGNDGSVDIVGNLGVTIDSCTTFSPPAPAPAGAGQSWLRSRWCGPTQSKDPAARATFGLYLGSEEVIFLRENF
ncbi:MAG: hypothetical protein IT529_04355 [Burkholderiales bacterium]|nr:hypothetical protein [Burkholderiales bacterium]